MWIGWFGHGEIAEPDADLLAFAGNDVVDAGEDTAVPGPHIEVGHLGDLWHISAWIDVVGRHQEHEVPVDAAEGRILRMHHEETHHAHGHLDHFVGMGVVHEGPALLELEFVDERLARLYVRLS